MPDISEANIPEGSRFLSDPPVFKAIFPAGGGAFVWNPKKGLVEISLPDETEPFVRSVTREEFLADARARS